jgi:hypothetical protein
LIDCGDNVKAGWYCFENPNLIATRPKKDIYFYRGLKIDTCLEALILQLNAYLLLLHTAA